jgi:hypothetical protein
MARRRDPEKIYAAQRAGTITRLRDGGRTQVAAERLVERWELEAEVRGIGRAEPDYWYQADRWFSGQVKSTTWRGFTSTIQSPADLLAKMRHDLARMRADPNDPYAAIDFFTGAESIIDWRYPGDKDQQKRVRSHEPAKTVSHLASGAKHFHATAPQHTTVVDTERDQDDGALAMMMPSSPSLMIERSNGSPMTAVEFAEFVLRYWTKELGPNGVHALPVLPP